MEDHLVLRIKTHEKKSGVENALDQEESVHGETRNIKFPPGKEDVALNYGETNRICEQNETNNISATFSYSVASDIMNDDLKPQSVIECQRRNDWAKWNEAIQVELNSFNKRNIFRAIILTLGVVKPLGYRWIFIRKKMSKTKLKDTRQDLWLKVSLNDLELIMRKIIHWLWMQAPLGI
jgi:hypothetical protein